MKEKNNSIIVFKYLKPIIVFKSDNRISDYRLTSLLRARVLTEKA